MGLTGFFVIWTWQTVWQDLKELTVRTAIIDRRLDVIDTKLERILERVVSLERSAHPQNASGTQRKPDR